MEFHFKEVTPLGKSFLRDTESDVLMRFDFSIYKCQYNMPVQSLYVIKVTLGHLVLSFFLAIMSCSCNLFTVIPQMCYSI